MKLLIGCPTNELYNYCLPSYIDSLKNLKGNFDILLVDNSPTNKYKKILEKQGINVIKDKYKERAIDRIVNSRNILRRYVLENNYDYLLSLEQDVLPESDVLNKLLSHNKKIVSGLYFTQTVLDKELQFVPVAYKEFDEKNNKMRFMTDQEILSNNLQKLRAVGLGCILIHLDVLEKIEFRYEKNTFDDVWFCNDARNKGYKIYIDPTAKCKHLVLKRPWKWSTIK